MLCHNLLSDVLGICEDANMVSFFVPVVELRFFGAGAGNADIEGVILGEERLVHMVHGQDVLDEVSACVKVVGRVRELDD